MKQARKENLAANVEEMVYSHLRNFDTLRNENIQYIESYHECSDCGDTPDNGQFASINGGEIKCLGCHVFDIEEASPVQTPPHGETRYISGLLPGPIWKRWWNPSAYR